MVVKSADRAFQILEAVGSRSEGMTHGELCKALGIPKGSLSYLLSNLMERDYLTFDRQSKVYMLGPELLVLTSRYLSNLDLVRVGRPVLRELVREVNEDAELAVMKDDQILFLHKEECSQPLKYSIAIGERAAVYATSAGKAILAYLPEEEVARYLSAVRLEPITRSTITDQGALREELKEVRAGGLAYGREEYHQGISAMAAPIFDRYGDVVGSAVVTIPSIRFNTGHKRAIEGKLLEAATEISRRLGFDRSVGEAGSAGKAGHADGSEKNRREIRKSF